MLFFGIFMIIFMVMVVFGGRFMHTFNNNYQGMTAGNTSGKEMLAVHSERYVNLWDMIWITVFVLFGIAIFVSMFMIDTHPALFFIVVFIFAVILIVLGIVGNIYDTMASDSPLSEDVAQFGVMSWVMSHWIQILTGFGFIAIVLLFAKMRTSWFQ